MSDNFEHRIKKIFCEEIGLEEVSVDDTTAYDSTEAWDSLKHLQLVSRLEEEFGFELPVDDVIDMSTFGRVKEIIRSNIDKKGVA